MHKHRQFMLSAPFLARLLILALVTIALIGCQAARKLRDAQDAFNDGARLENERLYETAIQQYGLIVNGQTDIDTPSVERPEQHYAAALEILESIGAPEEAELKKDRLLGTKLTLEALCQWKLGRGTQAISLAETALDHLDAENEPRDWVIARALPALVINDEAYAEIPNAFADKNQAEFDDVENRLLKGDKSAKSFINKAKGSAKNRPIEIWLLQVELALYANWIKARSNLLDERDIPDTEKVLLIDICDRLETVGQKYANEDQPDAPRKLADSWRITIFGTVNPTRPSG